MLGSVDRVLDQRRLTTPRVLRAGMVLVCLPVLALAATVQLAVATNDEAVDTVAETAAAVARMSATGVDIVVLVASVMLAEDDPERRLRDVVAAVIEADSSTVVGIYECPLPYHRVLSDEAVAWLAATGRFAFFKETSHDLDRMRRRVELAEGSGMQIFNAGIENLAESLTVGIAGLSGWVANVFPDGVARVHGLADGTAEPTTEALELQAALVDVEHRMGGSYPNSAKALVELRAGIGFAPRSRWRPAQVNEAEVAAILADASAVLGVPAR